MTNPLIGSQLGVNTNLAGDQYAPDVATLADGRSVVVWADGETIRARFVDSAASPSLSGGEIILATDQSAIVYAPTPTLLPKVAALSDGGFAVAWAANDKQLGYALGLNVYEQAFNADGTARGAKVIVGSDTGSTGGAGGVGLALDIAASPIRGFSVAYTDYNQYYGDFNAVELRNFDDAGTATDNGISLDTSFQSQGLLPSEGVSIATTADGNYIAAWKHYVYMNSGASGAQIVVGKYAADGSTVIAPVVVGSVTFASGQTPTTTNELNPVVGVLADGAIAVAWDHRTGSDDDIAYRLLGSSLTPATGVLTANDVTSGAQTAPTLVALPDGSFELGWTDTSGGDPNVVVRHFAGSGTPLDASFVASRIEAGAQTAPSLTARGSSEVALVWQDNSYAAITGQTIDPSGTSVQFQAVLPSGAAADARTDNPVITGTSGNDALYGGPTDDYFLGGAGVDTLTGGLGNDIYDIRNPADTIIENPNEGVDTVYAHMDYTLPANVENLVLADTARTAVGNADSNLLVGNDSDNVFFGKGGADTMVGGNGNDTYEVTDPSDQIIENPGGGTDGVFSYVNGYVLPGNVETLVLEGADHTAVGNAASNTLIGGSGDDVFFGGGGGDRMVGGAGNDVYQVTNIYDNVVENPGEGDADTVFSYLNWYQLTPNVETLVLEGSAVTGEGNDQANTLIGNALDNVFNGHGGDDTLTGGAGRDIFWWLGPNAGNDLITDFDAAGGEVVVVDRHSFANYAAIQAAETQVGSSVVITLNPTTSMTLANTNLGQLSTANFQYYSGNYS